RKIEAGETVGDDIREEMERPIEEREQSDHPAKTDRAVPPGDSTKRRHRQRDAQEAERPAAGLFGEIAERIGAQVAGERRPHEPSSWAERGDERRRLEHPFDDLVL